VTSSEQTAEMKMAREGRLFLKAKRVDIEKARKELKEQSLREGKAIDGIANVLKALIEPTEEYLEKQERFVEIQEENRRAEMKAIREAELTSLDVEPGFYDLAKMPEDAYVHLVKSIKDAKEDALRAAVKAEEDRIAKEKEGERVRVENERLKREAEANERQMAAERAKADAERERREREVAKLKAEADTKLRKEREERERLETAIRVKADAEREEKKRLADEAKKAQRAPDKEKLEAFAVLLDGLTLPTMKSEEAKSIAINTTVLLRKVSAFIRSKSQEL
jgi:hypothetical protein